MEFENQRHPAPVTLAKTSTPDDSQQRGTFYSAASTSSQNGLSNDNRILDNRSSEAAVVPKVQQALDHISKISPSDFHFTNCFGFDKSSLLPQAPYIDESTAANIASIAKSVAEVEKKRAEEKPYQCTLCSKRYVNSAGLTVHMLTHKPENHHNCPICHTVLPSKQALKQHSIIHANQHPNQCNICFKTFSYKSGLTHHMQEHAEDQLFTCGICRKVFSQRSNLNSHILSHSYEEKMTILKSPHQDIQKQNIAPSRAINSTKLFKDIRKPEDIHIALQTLQRQQMLPPPFPGNDRVHHTVFPEMMLKNQAFGIGRQESVSDDSGDDGRTFPCEVCHKRFKQKATMRTHMLTHVGSKPFSCNICDKRFTQKSGLDQHSVVHTGQRPHECPLCSKTFTQKANLNHHLLTHSGEKKFECILCGRRFTQKANLQTHILTHTGEKPYGCPVCHKRFTQKGGLAHHMQSQHSLDGGETSRATSTLTHQQDNQIVSPINTPSPHSFSSHTSSPHQPNMDMNQMHIDVTSVHADMNSMNTEVTSSQPDMTSL